VYTALSAASKTLQSYLKSRLLEEPDLAPFFGSSGSMQVLLNTPEEMTDRAIDGLSVWLYRIVRDEERVNAPAERTSDNRLRRTPLPLRLHYLITPVIQEATDNTPETIQKILGKVLQVFYEHPIFRGAELLGGLDRSQTELTVRLESLSLEEIARLYEALLRSYQVSAAYEVSVVYLDVYSEPERVSPVQVVTPNYGVIVAES
jgi:hypothetical protein